MAGKASETRPLVVAPPAISLPLPCTFFFAMRGFFLKSKSGKSFVVCVNGDELIRYRWNRNVQYSFLTNDFPPCHCSSCNDITSFINTVGKLDIQIRSYKGSNARVLDMVDDAIACHFSHQIGIMFMGTDCHFYALRFVVLVPCVTLTDIYEIPTATGFKMKHARYIPHSKEWLLCCVCFRASNPEFELNGDVCCSNRCRRTHRKRVEHNIKNNTQSKWMFSLKNTELQNSSASTTTREVLMCSECDAEPLLS